MSTYIPDPEHNIVNHSGLQSVPDSLSEQLGRFNRMVKLSEQAMNEGDHELARTRIKHSYQLLQSLAQTAPEYAAVLGAAAAGHTGFVVESLEQTHYSRTEGVSVLGVQIGTKTIVEPVTVKKQRVVRIF